MDRRFQLSEEDTISLHSVRRIPSTRHSLSFGQAHINRKLKDMAFSMHCPHLPRWVGHLGKQEYEPELQAELDKFKSFGFGVDDIQDEEQQWEGMVMLKDVCRPMRIKKQLREILFTGSLNSVKVFQGNMYRSRMLWMKYGLIWREFKMRFEFWHSSLNLIEGHQGTGVLSYFIFLRWILGINFVLSLMIVFFITLPMSILPPLNYELNDHVFINDTSEELSFRCSNLYFHANDTAVKHTVKHTVIEFFQGTGWLEKTPVFYGFYTDMALISLAKEKSIISYNLSLAYIIIMMSSFVILLCFMAKRSALIFKKLSGENTYNEMCNLVFGSWDFTMKGDEAVVQQKKFYNVFLSFLNEQRYQWLNNGLMSSYHTRYLLYLVRILVNLFVLGGLCGSAYVIYYVTDWSSKYVADKEKSTFILMVHYLPSLVLMLLNAGVPIIFNALVAAEFYKRAVIVKVKLIRTVFLRLASIAVVATTLYAHIRCSPKDACGTGTKPCTPIKCWETYVGQQFYKLMMLNFLVTVLKVFYYEIPRKKIAPCEFCVTENVLDLIYTQTIVWLGFFFAPMLPLFSVIHLILVFYSRMLSAMYACNSSKQLYRASRSNTFFVFVLMLTYLMCLLLLGYTITILPPSKGCGPLRTKESFLKILHDTIDDIGIDTSLLEIFKIVTSGAFILTLLILLCLILYYFYKRSTAYESNALYLKEELAMEGQAKQLLILKITNLCDKSMTFTETELEFEHQKENEKAARKALNERLAKKAAKESKQKSSKKYNESDEDDDDE